MRPFERKFASLLLLVCLLAAPAAAAAQADGAGKRAAVKRLVRASEMRAASARLFGELVTRYQRNWADSVITDFRNKGLFAKVPAEDVPRVERLIREFGDETFDEIKRRVSREFITDELMEAIAGPAFEKLLTAEEIESLVAFSGTPAGKKMLAASYKILADTVVATFEERGFFRLASSPEEESARLDRLAAEMRADPPLPPERMAAAWAALPADYFSAEEKRALLAFAASPAARKLADNLPVFLREVMANNARHAAPVGRLAVEVFNERLEVFAEKLGQISKKPQPEPPPPAPRAKGGGRPKR